MSTASYFKDTDGVTNSFDCVETQPAGNYMAIETSEGTRYLPFDAEIITPLSGNTEFIYTQKSFISVPDSSLTLKRPGVLNEGIVLSPTLAYYFTLTHTFDIQKVGDENSTYADKDCNLNIYLQHTYVSNYRVFIDDVVVYTFPSTAAGTYHIKMALHGLHTIKVQSQTDSGKTNTYYGWYV